MAVGSVDAFPANSGPLLRDGIVFVPVAPSTKWVTACTNPFASDNSGSEVVNPSAITRSALNKVRVELAGTTLLISLKYKANVTASQQCVIQAFGIDQNGVYHRLRDSSGDHALTLQTAATDVTDGTDKWTDPVEVDLDGSLDVLVTVKTPFDTSAGTETGEIVVKPK